MFIFADIALFYAALYREVLAPDSSTATFERAVSQFQAWPADSRRDVLVLGDSRIYAGLDPSTAGSASGGLRFLNAGIPGTTPRCWYYFDRAIDPIANRFRAVVIPVDTYGDDTGAIGSIDAADHAADLRYVLFQTGLADVLPLARSFEEPELRRDVAFDVLLRGPVLRDDFQSLLTDPSGRLSALKGRLERDFDPIGWHPFPRTLATLRVNFRDDRIAYPAWVSVDEKTEIQREVLPVPVFSASYARYRERWLEPMVRRYQRAGVPVLFVRIPTRPTHRRLPEGPSGSLTRFASVFGAGLIPQSSYVALEQPNLFADHDHLDIEGSRRFSVLLGHDVKRALDGGPSAAPQAGPDRDYAQPPAVEPSGGRGVHFLLVTLRAGVPIPFQSIDFVLFFTMVLVAFYAAPRRIKPLVLLTASYYFYLRWNAWYVVLLAILTVSDFTIALALGRASPGKRKLLMAMGVGANIAFLAAFKYLNFMTSSVAALLGMRESPWLLELIVPVGISFHTFQSISYLVDVSRGRVKAVKNLADYALYIAFFPQLLAGPIVRATRFFEELFHWHPPAAGDVERGAREILLGLVKKLVIADQFAPIANAYFGAVDAHPGAAEAWGGAFAFAMQIYFDFSGYSDIAIGSARLLGFAFPDNFMRPYLAISISDFWRRWNISLSSWFRDYLYIPLGGNRAGGFATQRNLILTMLLAGLWHGANWTFVAWGGYHGILLVIGRGLKLNVRREVGGLGRVVRIALTFVLVLVGWILFRAHSFSEAFHVMKALVSGGGSLSPLEKWPYIAVAGALLIGVAQERGAKWEWQRRPVLLQAVALSFLLLAVETCSWPGQAAPFVYFKF